MKIADRYVTDAGLGAGGMGQIWEGTDERLNRKVAIKLIHPGLRGDSSAVRRRFYREARVLARLRHPGIPVLYDFGQHEDDLFIVMELFPQAASLKDLVGERGADRVPAPWAAAIGAQMCAALAAAHRTGLIHRDLTPSNIVLAPDGTVKILDFGVAAALDRAEFSEITHPGEVPGSVLYMAPETDGHRPADARSDLYSVGCVLYELLSGERLFLDPSLAREVARHRTDEPRPFATFRDDVPEPVERLVLALLAKSPSDRPATAAEVARALLPHARELPPLPGFYAPTPDDPTRLYATAVATLPN